MSLYFTYESRDILKSFNLFTTVKAKKLNLRAIDKFEKLKKFAAVVHALQTTQNLDISRCFAGNSKKMCKELNARAQPLFCS